MLKRLAVVFLWLLVIVPVRIIAQQTQIAEVANTLTTQFGQKGRKVIAVSKFTNDDGFDDRFSRLWQANLPRN